MRGARAPRPWIRVEKRKQYIALSRDIRRGDNSNAGIWCCASIVILSDMSMVVMDFWRAAANFLSGKAS